MKRKGRPKKGRVSDGTGAGFLDARFRAGYDGPEVGCKIHTMVRATSDAIVYLDEAGRVRYAYSGGELDGNLPGVLNVVALIEAIPIDCFLTDDQKFQFRCLTGVGVAQILCGGKEEEAYGILDQAEQYAKNRGKEAARRWLVTSTGICAAVVSVVGMIAWLGRRPLSNVLGVTGFHLLMGGCAGALGAYVSVVSRSTAIPVEPEAGKRLHYLEAISRVATGMIGAVIVGLGVKTKFIFGNVGPSSDLALVFLACLISGASERLVPSMIRKAEVVGTDDPPHEAGKK